MSFLVYTLGLLVCVFTAGLNGANGCHHYYRGFCYEVLEEELGHFDAREKCHAMSGLNQWGDTLGGLAALDDSGIEKFVKGLLSEPFQIGYFADSNSDFIWEDGWYSTSTYTNWAPGEPNPNTTEKRCTLFDPSLDAWFVISCYQRAKSICQIMQDETVVMILWDVSGSVNGHHPKASILLDNFLDATTADDFDDNEHITHLYVIGFDSDILLNTTAEMRYYDYQTNAGARTDGAGMARYIEDKETKTNIGKSIESLLAAIGPWNPARLLMLVVSDFINIQNVPDLGGVLDSFKDRYHAFPVIIDKELRDETMYELFKAHTQDGVGVDLRDPNIDWKALLEGWYSNSTFV